MCSHRGHLHTARASNEEADASTDRESEGAPLAADDSFWSSRSTQAGAPEMPFGMLLGLASAGALETAYLTAVSGPILVQHVYSECSARRGGG